MDSTASLPAAHYITDGGLDAEAIQHQLQDSYVFELTYRTHDEKKRTQYVTQESVNQPSTTSPHNVPVFRFTAVEYDQTVSVRLSDIVALNSIPLTLPKDRVREAAIRSMASDVTDGPVMVPISDIFTTLQMAVNHFAIRKEHHVLIFNTLRSSAYEDQFTTLGKQIFDLLEQSDTGSEQLSLTAIIQYADNNPDALVEYTSELCSLLETPSYTEEAIKCLAQLAEDDPSYVIDAVPALATAAESANTDTQEWVVYTFSKIASSHPEELFPVIDTLSTAVQTGVPNLQLNALSALGHITSSYPDATTSIVDELAGLLTSDHAPIRKNAVGILGDMAQKSPGLVINHAVEIADCLTDDAADTRRNATITLLQAGEADPSAVKAEHNALAAALNDVDPNVRANACTLIGNTRAPVSPERLRTLRDTDPDDRVQQEAARALNRIR